MAKRAATAHRRKAIIDAFDAAHPVERRSDLLDRDDKLELLFEAVIDRRQHAIIHGPRGSGKTSLVRVFGDYADQQGAIVIYLLCEPTTDFATLMEPYLDFLPAYALKPGVSAPRNLSSARALTSYMAEALEAQVIFILDEFDRVTDEPLQAEVATFMKLLSDARSSLQLVLVGIASSVDTLIDNHLSLRRHLTAVDVGRLTDKGAREIIEQGSSLSGVPFDQAATDLIVSTSCGSPYHVRLFCQSACVAMLRSGRNRVDLTSAYVGLSIAVNAWGALNQGDFELFAHLCDGSERDRALLRQVAEMAAGGMAALQAANVDDDGAGTKLLGTSLVKDTRKVGRMIFRDSLAPQFLLAILNTAEWDEQQADHSNSNIPNGVNEVIR